MSNKEEVVDQPGSLMIKTREMLKASGLTVIQVYEATGISIYWQRKFINGEMTNPSVNRVQKLYEFLRGESLSI